MVRKSYSDSIREVAEMNNLVTSPPRNPVCIRILDWIKQYTDEMNCVEVTITYKPTLQYTTDKTLKAITEGSLRACMGDKGSAILLHEYSKGGHFHYHGILSGCSKKTLSTIRKQFTIHIGRIELKTITYYESYLNYITKDTMDGDYDTDLNIYIV